MKKLCPEIQEAYAVCKKIAHHHYENFPIASFFLPKAIRDAITVIYAFARTADDIADEGDFTPEQRLEKLQQFTLQLDYIQYPISRSPTTAEYPTYYIFLALQHVLITHALPITLFYDLLTAFKQDILPSEYQTFEDVLNYCRYSANPIGRLLLHLMQLATTDNLFYSDKICTGLQLINFLQDLDSDLQIRNRCYIPLSDLQAFNVTTQQLKERCISPNRDELLQHQLKRIQTLYNAGKPLGKILPGLFGLEVRFTIEGGQQILNQLQQRTHTYIRPKLNFRNWLSILWYGLLYPSVS